MSDGSMDRIPCPLEWGPCGRCGDGRHDECSAPHLPPRPPSLCHVPAHRDAGLKHDWTCQCTCRQEPQALF